MQGENEATRSRSVIRTQNPQRLHIAAAKRARRPQVMAFAIQINTPTAAAWVGRTRPAISAAELLAWQADK